MRLTQSLIKITKDIDKDVTLISHNLLTRGSFISKSGSGLYSMLPLGMRVLNNIKKIVQKEMNLANSIEIMLPFVTPAKLWEESGRLNKFGSELICFKDRKESKYVLSPTNEEAVVDLIKDKLNSYKDLPINVYQIATKFRDETRPRYGLLRAREFMMKDAYGFHHNRESLDIEFDIMYKAYSNILDKIGLEYRVVDAHSGAIGGDSSKEFMVLANSGEDTILICNNCNYASNIEVATSECSNLDINLNFSNGEMINTPEFKTISEVSNFLKISSSSILKAIAKNIIYDDGRNEVVLFLLSGNDELVVEKAQTILGFSDIDDDLSSSDLVLGYIGLSIELINKYRVIADIRLKGVKNIITGANIKNHHKCVDLSSFNLDFSDIRRVNDGESCSKCKGGMLTYKSSIEVGHIFKLGDSYSRSLKAQYLDENGKQQYFLMGCYGFGLSRLMAAYLEQKGSISGGCKWSLPITPFKVHLINIETTNSTTTEYSNLLYQRLMDSGIDVLYDDKKGSFGVKIGNAELIGCFLIIIIGKKFVNDNLVEVRIKDSTSMISSKELDSKIEELLNV